MYSNNALCPLGGPKGAQFGIDEVFDAKGRDITKASDRTAPKLLKRASFILNHMCVMTVAQSEAWRKRKLADAVVKAKTARKTKK